MQILPNITRLTKTDIRVGTTMIKKATMFSLVVQQ